MRRSKGQAVDAPSVQGRKTDKLTTIWGTKLLLLIPEWEQYNHLSHMGKQAWFDRASCLKVTAADLDHNLS